MLDVFVLMLNKDRLDARRIVDRSAIIGIKLDTTETDIYINHLGMTILRYFSFESRIATVNFRFKVDVVCSVQCALLREKRKIGTGLWC